MEKTIGSILQRGEIVPTDIVVQLLKKEIAATAEKATYVLDDFPRTIAQAPEFEEAIAEIKFAVLLDAPHEVLQQRLIGRGSLTGRPGDTEAVVKQRFRNYYLQSFPVVEFYKAQGKIHVVDSTTAINEVYQHVHTLLR